MPAPEGASSSQARRGAGRGVAIAALILMLGNALSRVLGLVREQLAAGYFGAGDDIAAFTIADNLQTLLYDLMVSGALQAALIPVLATLALPGVVDRAELRQVGGGLVTWALAGTGVLALLGVVFAPELVDAFLWFSGDGAARGEETRELTVRLVRIVLPAAVLLALGTVLQAMLHALGAVTAPALSTAVRNLAVIVLTVVLADALGVESMAWGTLAGAGLIVMIQLWPLSRRGALPAPNLQLRNPAIRRIGELYLPVLVGLLVSSAAIVVDRGLAWGAGELAVGAMRYATTLVQLVLGLVAAALALASLPVLARHFGAGDERAFGHALGRVLGMVTVLILPAAAGLAVLAGPVAMLLFGHGETGTDGVDAIALALLGYLPGMVAAAFDQVLMFALYARHNTRLPVLVILLGVAVYLIFAYGTVDRYGMMGLVIANSAQFIARAAVLWWAMRRLGSLGMGSIATRTLRGSIVATVGMAAATLLAVGALRIGGVDPGYGASLVAKITLVAVPMAVGSAVYLALLRTLDVRELTTVVAAVRTRMGSRPR